MAIGQGSSEILWLIKKNKIKNITTKTEGLPELPFW